MATSNNSRHKDQNTSASQVKGSGSDLNSDQRRLSDQDNLLDKTIEDSFPASDAAPQTARSGAGHKDAQARSLAPADLKENKAAQFEYGRDSQAKTQHFDTSTDRLRKGNPDIGNVDLGTIEAGKPSQQDDDDHFDSADDSSDDRSETLEQAERKADIGRQNEY